MALKLDIYETKQGQIYNDAYIRIQRIDTVNVDYEFFDSSTKPDVELEVKWTTRIESNAKIFVWSDEQARERRARVVDWFDFDFDYDLTSFDNIYKQAYKQLNQKKFNGTGINV